MSRRLKSPAQTAPTTLEEAQALLRRFATLAIEVERLDQDSAEAVARIKAAASEALAPIATELKEIVRQLKPWWAVAGEELTEGKRKSVELGGCLIGVRTSNPRLTYAGQAPTGDMEAMAIAVLQETGWASDLVRERLSLDKPGIMRALDGEFGAMIATLGFGILQREEFFVDRVAARPPAPAIDEDVEAGEVA